MNFLRRETICSMLRLSPQQSYRIIGATEYGARISSAAIVEMLNRSRVGDIQVICGDGGECIPSDLVTASDAVANCELINSGISTDEILRWSNRRRNPLPHYRLNRKTRRYRVADIVRWLDKRSPKIIGSAL